MGVVGLLWGLGFFYFKNHHHHQLKKNLFGIGGVIPIYYNRRVSPPVSKTYTDIRGYGLLVIMIL
jgi:hypothetical protein